MARPILRFLAGTLAAGRRRLARRLRTHPVAYHSRTGNTEKMAARGAEGAASVAGTEIGPAQGAEATADDI